MSQHREHTQHYKAVTLECGKGDPFVSYLGVKQGNKEASVLRQRFGSSEACELQQFFLLEFTQKDSKPGIQQKPVCGWLAYHMDKS